MRGAWMVLVVLLFVGPSLTRASDGFCNLEELRDNGSDAANGRATAAPTVGAYRLDGETIELDGVLDDPAWGKAEAAWGFSQWDPARGEAPSEETVFKVVYDDEAVYFGVACLTSDCDEIQAVLCRRDHAHDSDIISLYIDTYHDHTTGYNFRVTPLGVQGDRYVYNDGHMDRDWDAVWEAEASRDGRGWYAEFRIPFSCVRYRESDEMTWGCNLYRYMHNKGEDTSWVTWDTETRGFVSRFGEITGFRDVPAARQLEIMPYIVGRVTDPSAVGDEDELDDFENIGVDIKYGVTSDFTLNATVQPDFGQVEADPALLNLSPFETYYQEKRPFFLEGNRFFEHPNFNVFYSRRIGTGDENSRIRFAGKLTGKTAQGVSAALLYASTDVTGEGQAHNVFKSGEQQSHYMVGRVGKEFADGAHRVNVMQTGVFRSAERETAGDDEFPSRDAWTTAADFDFNFRDRDYNVQGAFLGTVIDPDPVPDDPSVDHEKQYGTNGYLGIRKLGGTILGGVSGRWESDKLNPNDLGFLSSPDEIASSAWIQYEHHSTEDDALVLQGNVHMSVWKNWLYADAEGYDHDTGELVWSYDRGQPQYQGAEVSTWGQLSSYWSVWSGVGFEPGGHSKYSTRTYDGERGPLMRYPDSYWSWLGFNTDYRKPLAGSVNLNLSGNERGALTRRVGVNVDWTATETMTYSLGVAYRRSHSEAQHVENFGNPGGGIGGVSYVFAELDQETFDATFRADILFSRDLSLQLYAQPYITVGDYANARELLTPDSYDLAPPEGLTDFDVDDYDFTYSAVNVNAVMRWEYMPGSTLYLVWKQGRDLYEDRFDVPGLDTSLDFNDLFDNEPENVLLAKVTYWFSI